jgi:galactokinase
MKRKQFAAGIERIEMNKAMDLREKFRSLYGAEARVYRAPGRVNLIGEHTDYNEGFVLPAAIDFSCCVAMAAREDRKLVVYSENYGESAEVDLDFNAPRLARTWTDYPASVAWSLEQAGYRLRGANIYLRGDVPLGAGLSSSAAIEVAVGYGLLDVSGHGVERTRLALLCQKAENEFVGARCGIMDQFVSCYGREGHALLLDCRSLGQRLIRIPENIRLVICNTMVRHELGAGEYNARRAQCEEGVRRLAEVLPGIRALRDVTPGQLEEHRGRLSETIYRRCRHVITENERVDRMAVALESGDTVAMTELTAESHRSLREDYEVSCAELDLLVQLAAGRRGVYGARMTGGGFGGCTVNLVNAADAAEFQQSVSAGYYAATGKRPDIWICESSAGAEAIES